MDRIEALNNELVSTLALVHDALNTDADQEELVRVAQRACNALNELVRAEWFWEKIGFFDHFKETVEKHILNETSYRAITLPVCVNLLVRLGSRKEEAEDLITLSKNNLELFEKYPNQRERADKARRATANLRDRTCSLAERTSARVARQSLIVNITKKTLRSVATVLSAAVLAIAPSLPPIQEALTEPAKEAICLLSSEILNSCLNPEFDPSSVLSSQEIDAIKNGQLISPLSPQGQKVEAISYTPGGSIESVEFGTVTLSKPRGNYIEPHLVLVSNLDSFKEQFQESAINRKKLIILVDRTTDTITKLSVISN